MQHVITIVQPDSSTENDAKSANVTPSAHKLKWYEQTLEMRKCVLYVHDIT